MSSTESIEYVPHKEAFQESSIKCEKHLERRWKTPKANGCHKMAKEKLHLLKWIAYMNGDARWVLKRHRVGQQALQPTESTWLTLPLQCKMSEKNMKNSPNCWKILSQMFSTCFLERTCSCAIHHIDVLSAYMHNSASNIISKEVGQNLLQCCATRHLDVAYEDFCLWMFVVF